MGYTVTKPGERGRMTELYAREEMRQLGAIPLRTTAGRLIVPDMTPKLEVTTITSAPEPNQARLAPVSATQPVKIAPEPKPDLPSRDIQIEKAKTQSYKAALENGTVVSHPTTGEPVITLPPSLPPSMSPPIKTAPLPTNCVKTAPVPQPPPAPLTQATLTPAAPEIMVAPPAPSQPTPGLFANKMTLAVVGIAALGVGWWLWSRK